MVITNMKQFHFHLKNAGFQNSYFYVGSDRNLALQSCVEEFKTKLPNLDKTIGKIVNIPVGWWVTKVERKYIVDCIKKGW